MQNKNKNGQKRFLILQIKNWVIEECSNKTLPSYYKNCSLKHSDDQTR